MFDGFLLETVLLRVIKRGFFFLMWWISCRILAPLSVARFFQRWHCLPLANFVFFFPSSLSVLFLSDARLHLQSSDIHHSAGRSEIKAKLAITFLIIPRKCSSGDARIGRSFMDVRVVKSKSLPMIASAAVFLLLLSAALPLSQSYTYEQDGMYCPFGGFDCCKDSEFIAVHDHELMTSLGTQIIYGLMTELSCTITFYSKNVFCGTLFLCFVCVYQCLQ